MPQKSPKEIIEILHSIKDVRLDENGDLEVLFDPPNPSFPDGWERCGSGSSFNYGSFTHQLICLIQDDLNVELAND